MNLSVLSFLGEPGFVVPWYAVGGLGAFRAEFFSMLEVMGGMGAVMAFVTRMMVKLGWKHDIGSLYSTLEQIKDARIAVLVVVPTETRETAAR